MTTVSAATSKILLVNERAAADGPAAKVRRYRLARLRLEAKPPGAGRRGARRRDDD